MTRLGRYARLMRLHAPVGIWLVFFPAFWAVALAGGGIYLLALCFLGAVLTRSAGCIINDLTDRRLDAGVARTAARPLAAGDVSRREALILLFILLMLALLLALSLPPLVLLLSCAALPLIVLYPWMKRITWWPQAFLGLTFNLSALIGWAAATETLAPAAFFLYAAAACWTFGYDTLYAHQDAADDARMGIKSSARALGKHTRAAVALSYALCSIGLFAAGTLCEAAWPYYLGAGAAMLHFFWQVTRINPQDGAGCGALFRSNVWPGACLALGAWMG